MESNKLLIGLQFLGAGGEDIFIELIVLRDMTLSQLFDGIKYGLAKKAKQSPYCECKQIFDICNSPDSSGVYRRICLTSHNNGSLSGGAHNGRFVISENDLSRTLAEIGFISSTRVVFDPQEEYDTFQIIDSSVDIIPAFNPKERNNSHMSFPDYNISTRQLHK
ncbi:MAG: hypothetical protein J6Z29_02820, partial [Ruminococcus sp.]|nr:hypothetical protein [Ruminococcus sp.]